MLTQTMRPKTFKSVAGQDIPVKVMKKAVIDPENAARVYLFHGFYGVGKTTLARVFAVALNCESKGIEPCGVCSSCTTDLNYAPFIEEYDCGATGSVDDIRKIRDTMVLDSSLAKYRVIVFDEFHMASKQAQNALLKVLEELSSNTFVILCTTEHDKILSTIHSRSVELFFKKLSKERTVELLKDISEAKGFSYSDDVLDTIAEVSNGHARDAVKTLDLIEMAGTEVLESYENVRTSVHDALIAIKDEDEIAFRGAVADMTSGLRSQYTSALYNTVYEMIRPEESELSIRWGSDVYKLFYYLLQPWAVSALSRDVTTKSLMWLLWFKFKSKINLSVTEQRSQKQAERFRTKGQR